MTNILLTFIIGISIMSAIIITYLNWQLTRIKRNLNDVQKHNKHLQETLDAANRRIEIEQAVNHLDVTGVDDGLQSDFRD